MNVTPPLELLQALRRLGLIECSEIPQFTALSGGVSSDIWRVDTRRGSLCLKRALPKLKVAADWYAPLVRSAYEFDWLKTVGKMQPDIVPKVLGYDETSHAFAMTFLPNEQYPIWKQQLRHGQVNPGVAAQVGSNLAKVHSSTAKQPQLAARFQTDELFHALRLSPYLEATAAVHPELAAELLNLSDTTAQTKLTLVHGDISPK
ncbi:MAG: phosphotransferase, partial [Pseudomonadota bacterium]